MLPSLHPIKVNGTVYTKQGQIWCVPAALASLTGLPYETCAEACVRNGASPSYGELDGVHHGEAVLALRDMVPTATAEPVDLVARFPDLSAGPSIRRYMRDQPVTEQQYPILLSTGHHMMVAHRGWIGGNDTMRPCPYMMYPKIKGRRVVWTAVVKGL